MTIRVVTDQKPTPDKDLTQMDILEKLAQTYGFQPGAGYVGTALESVRFFWSTEPVPRAPLIYKAGLVLILQGHKTGYLGKQIFSYNPDHYLVLTVPLPFECDTDASPDNPLLGLFIDIDQTDLFDMIRLMAFDTHITPKPPSLAVAPARLGDEMRDAVRRLMNALCSKAASQAIGPGIVREILFHTLNGPRGGALRALAQSNSHAERIARSITRIREDFAHPIRIEDLARDAGMSAPAFHRHFRSMTGSSPLQYLKATRLNRAKGLIVTHGISVSNAARQVGYENAAHFSREFKKHFGVSASRAKDAGYAAIDI